MVAVISCAHTARRLFLPEPDRATPSFSRTAAAAAAPPSPLPTPQGPPLPRRCEAYRRGHGGRDRRDGRAAVERGERKVCGLLQRRPMGMRAREEGRSGAVGWWSAGRKGGRGRNGGGGIGDGTGADAVSGVVAALVGNGNGRSPLSQFVAPFRPFPRTNARSHTQTHTHAW